MVDFRLSDDRHRFNVSSADVAADVSLWVDALRFPGVMAVNVYRPPDQQSDDGGHGRLWAASIFGFTSAPEVLAFNPADAVKSLTTEEVPNMARERGHNGVVINPAGPWIRMSFAEIFG